MTDERVDQLHIALYILFKFEVDVLPGYHAFDVPSVKIGKSQLVIGQGRDILKDS